MAPFVLWPLPVEYLGHLSVISRLISDLELTNHLTQFFATEVSLMIPRVYFSQDLYRSCSALVFLQFLRQNYTPLERITKRAQTEQTCALRSRIPNRVVLLREFFNTKDRNYRIWHSYAILPVFKRFIMKETVTIMDF